MFTFLVLLLPITHTVGQILQAEALHKSICNIQNPVATVAVQTDFQVIATDSLNPGCTAIDTVTVFPNINNISATLSGPTSICQGDLVTLSWNQ